ncbi:probable 2-oxoglutarate/Fe(II)-dependent dioxygenase [Chenopodium quinoa]|uniref:probable 2-oxoglutarate/Fe(II)-dependent dioxygenase n=1 Tax=Chenopodium quinoa TaxID=63459 RepID=UPI000B796207|nr:probable 2-oxoglutarate/Fe(II)-dependent dioxygenase [Chenopodium quinoa]
MDTQDSFHEASIVSQDGSLRVLRVPVVQELSRHGVQDVPKMFLRPPSDTLSTAISCLPENFPSISMAKLRASEVEERKNEQQKLADGLREYGMVLVREHGIPFSLLSAAKEVIKGFFKLSFEEKKRSVGTYASVDNMGYGRNFVKSDDKPLDWIDRLTMKVAPKESTQGLNVWPQKPANFREVIERYAEEARKLSDEILQALAEALSLEKIAFVKYLDPKTREINVRINYYPPCPKPNSTIGLSPHTDGSVLTLLMQFDTSGGLQVMHKDKKIWLSVPWPTDALLVNAGDFLEIMSNGKVQSSWHRAVTQADSERYSLALFCNPPLSKEIEPVKSDDSSDYEYKKVVVSDYLQHFYKVSPTLSKVAIQYAMV